MADDLSDFDSLVMARIAAYHARQSDLVQSVQCVYCERKRPATEARCPSCGATEAVHAPTPSRGRKVSR